MLKQASILVGAVLITASPLFAQKKTSNVVLILPFCAKQIVNYPGAGYEELGSICREYYQGIKLALDSLERAEIPVHLSVFDTENDSLILVKLLKKQELLNADLIIGPLRSGGNKVLSNFAMDKGIYHVSPLMTLSRTHVDDPYWISCNPDLPTYGSFLYSFIASQKDSSANIIVVRDKSSLDKAVCEGLKKFGAGNGKNIRIKYVDYPSKNFDLIKHLSLTLPNHIIIPTNSESNVNAILRNVKDTNDGFDITCHGFPKWLEFKNTDHTVFERMRVHIATPSYVNYENEDVKRFVTTYRDAYYCEPTEPAFKGFDQALLLMTALNRDGKSMIINLSTQSIPTLHTTFRFRCSDAYPGYQNMYLNLIKLENLKQKKVN